MMSASRRGVKSIEKDLLYEGRRGFVQRKLTSHNLLNG